MPQGGVAFLAFVVYDIGFGEILDLDDGHLKVKVKMLRDKVEVEVEVEVEVGSVIFLQSLIIKSNQQRIFPFF